MTTEFYLITWEEFQNRKLVEKKEIVKTDSISEALSKLTEMNAKARKTTTSYKAHNLSALFMDKSLSIKEEVKKE